MTLLRNALNSMRMRDDLCFTGEVLRDSVECCKLPFALVVPNFSATAKRMSSLARRKPGEGPYVGADGVATVELIVRKTRGILVLHIRINRSTRFVRSLRDLSLSSG